MSYCRFAEDSDVYVYQSFKSLVVQVANNRGHIPTEYKGPLCLTGEFFHPIGLPSDGKEFHVTSPEDCITILNRLAEEGYMVPMRAFERLTAETCGLPS